MRLDTQVLAADPQGITVSRQGEERRIAAHNIVWAAGVRAVDLAGQLGTPTDVAGRLLVDNSRSMTGEQQALARAFDRLIAELEAGPAAGDYHIAVLTTGMASEGCPACPAGEPHYFSCINQNGESGRFEQRLGSYSGDEADIQFTFSEDAGCRVMDAGALDCFYDAASDSGVALTGINGCGYERGLAAVQAALSEPLLSGWNAGFLRPEAALGIVVVSDEDDRSRVKFTAIEFASDAPSAEVLPACSTPGCDGSYCQAFPGTRYIELAGLFGDNGRVRSICRTDFDQTLAATGLFMTNPQLIRLERELAAPESAVLRINGQAIPRHVCGSGVPTELSACDGPDDTRCGDSACRPVWSYRPPSKDAAGEAPGGYLAFAAGMDLRPVLDLAGSNRLLLGPAGE